MASRQRSSRSETAQRGAGRAAEPVPGDRPALLAAIRFTRAGLDLHKVTELRRRSLARAESVR